MTQWQPIEITEAMIDAGCKGAFDWQMQSHLAKIWDDEARASKDGRFLHETVKWALMEVFASFPIAIQPPKESE